ncbi:MAG TPA: GDSL-type esterase/lipase family protein [Kofleriaceae bacterium]|nr:GDSL-type esterase/lipase family protein [Kofleriaceae bacterium]
MTSSLVAAISWAALLGALATGCNGQAVEAQPKVPSPEAAMPVVAGPTDGGVGGDEGDPTAPVALPPAPVIEAPPGALEPFYAALDRAERGLPDGRVGIVQFGDSHTAGDHLTGFLRRALGGRFGDAGRGFVLAGKPPIRHYYLRDVRYGSTGKWGAELGGKKDNVGPFGLAGVRAHSDRKDAIAWVESCEQCGSDRVARFDVFYLRTPTSGTLGYRVDDGPWQKHPTKLTGAAATAADARQAAVLSVPVAEGRHRLSLRPQGKGRIELFGVALERGTPGVVIDVLGVVGRRLGHLRSWEWDVIGPQLAARAPALVVLQYGTNEADQVDLDLGALARHYDDVIALIRSHAPGASILVLGPPDMGVRDAGKACDKLKPPPRGAPVDLDAGVAPECVWHTPAILPLVIATQREAAARNGVAFFDSFAALGGADRMDVMFHLEPPLAYSDHVHLTQPGAELWGQHLVDALLAGYDAWKRQALASGQP